jgi:asparagine synthase (glutamine-hydrolysing)
MCGINAVINIKNNYRSSQKLLNLIEEMNSCVNHRGPDGEGYHIDEKAGVALGHKRLAIVDLSDKGHQPMLTESRSVITFNGEIFNYVYLRQSLEKKGINFTSTSDTEVLLKGLELEGSDFLAKIDGQFALVFVNGQTKDIFIARDQFGEKPLYYLQENENFFVASELTSLSKINNSLSIGSESIQMFLLFQ